MFQHIYHAPAHLTYSSTSIMLQLQHTLLNFLKQNSMLFPLSPPALTPRRAAPQDSETR
jgi:hypothetical protein